MKENTNKSLVLNSIILYVRLIITSLCGFIATRYALSAIGIVDYGLFSVMGSIITFISIINTIMVSTSNRYIAVAIGKGDTLAANKLFNICLQIHAVVAVLTFLFAFPIGYWYIGNVLNYEGDIYNAYYIFTVSTLASIFSFLIVPYQGLITAKERFFIFCIPDIISSILRLCLAYILLFYFEQKVIIYATFIAITTIYPSAFYIYYCKKHFGEIVRLIFIRDKNKTREIIGFSTWVAYGAVAYVSRAQGAAILVNAFFNTVMNTALGIANSINSIIGLVAKSISQPIDPQVTKAYSSGDKLRCNKLLIFSTKITYLVVFLVSVPFLVECEWILSIWLGQVPPYATSFTLLIIADTLLDSLNSGIKSIIFASGKIKLFQIIPSTLKLLSIIAAFVALKLGYPPYSLLVAYIGFTFLIILANQWILHRELGYDNSILIKNSYFPSLCISIGFLPMLYLCNFLNLHPVLSIVLSLFYSLILVYIIVLKKEERHFIANAIAGFFRRFM